MLHCLEHLYADSGFHLGGVFFLYRVCFAYNTWRETITALGAFRLLDSIDFATLQPCSSSSPSPFSSSFSSSASSSSSSSSSSPSSSSSSSSPSSSLSSSSTHSCYHHFGYHQFPSSFWSATSSTLKNWRCLWLAATPKNHVRPLPHSDFTLLYNPPLWLPPYPSPASFHTSPWPQV